MADTLTDPRWQTILEQEKAGALSPRQQDLLRQARDKGTAPPTTPPLAPTSSPMPTSTPTPGNLPVLSSPTPTSTPSPTPAPTSGGAPSPSSPSSPAPATPAPTPAAPPAPAPKRTWPEVIEAMDPWRAMHLPRLSLPDLGSAPAAPADPSAVKTAQERFTPVLGEDPLGAVLGAMTPEERQIATSTALKTGANVADFAIPFVVSKFLPISPTIPASQYAQMSKPAVKWLIQEVGWPAFRALAQGTSTFVTTLLSNLVQDPESQRDPWTQALFTSLGEFAGSVGGNQLHKKPPGWVTRTFGESETGTTIRQGIEAAGGEAPMALTTRNKPLQWLGYGSQFVPWPSRSRRVYGKAQELVEKALKDVNDLHPGGEVETATQALRGGVTAHANDNLLYTVPKRVQAKLETVIANQNALTTQTYEGWDQATMALPIHWGPAKAALPDLGPDFLTKVSLGEVGAVQPPALVHQLMQTVAEMKALPDTIPLQTAMQYQNKLLKLYEEFDLHFSRIEAKLDTATRFTDPLQKIAMPELGTALNEVQQLTHPHFVDLGPAQERARGVIAGYERGLEVPNALVNPGRAGRTPGTVEDAEILAARTLLDKPRWVPMGDAHLIRSKFGDIGRVPGLAVGNDSERIGREMATLIRDAMKKTADDTGHPGLYSQWVNAEKLYGEGAELLNSTLLTQVRNAPLDELLRSIVQNESPNDLKMLREALGDPLFHDMGRMWLTRMIRSRQSEPLLHLNASEMLQELNQLTGVAEKALFPHGIAPIKQALRQSEAMHKALTETNPVLMKDYRQRVNDPTLWSHVQADWVRGGLHMTDGQIDGHFLRSYIDNALGAKKGPGIPSTLGELFPNRAAIDELYALATAAEKLQHQAGAMRYAPLVRMAEGTGLILGAAHVAAHPLIAGAILLTHTGLDRALTNPKFTKWLTRAIQTPATSSHAPQVIGAMIGELLGMGLSAEELQIQGAPQVPEVP